MLEWTVTADRDSGRVISSSGHTLGISTGGGKTQTTERPAHPATLTILGSKVSTCFRRAFMVFPVSMMAWGRGGAKEEGEMKMGGTDEGHSSAEWQTVGWETVSNYDLTVC